MADHAHEPGHPEVGHVVPVKLLVTVLLALLFLTVVTVAISYVDLGPFNFAVAMAVALVKASLVCLFFMHLRWDKPFNTVLFVSSLFFLALFIGFCVLDTQEYKHQIDPTYSEQMYHPQYKVKQPGE